MSCRVRIWYPCPCFLAFLGKEVHNNGDEDIVASVKEDNYIHLLFLLFLGFLDRISKRVYLYVERDKRSSRISIGFLYGYAIWELFALQWLIDCVGIDPFKFHIYWLFHLVTKEFAEVFEFLVCSDYIRQDPGLMCLYVILQVYFFLDFLFNIYHNGQPPYHNLCNHINQGLDRICSNMGLISYFPVPCVIFW